MLAFGLVLLCLLRNCYSQEATVTVEVTEGVLRGYRTTSVRGTPYYTFQGVPFAAPPVGELRFVEPQPALQWEGVLNATEEPTPCPQSGLQGEEDCLYLNVYTPQLNPDQLKTVMVWIHGGGFSMGEGSKASYGPDFFIDQDVVVASIAYRLTTLGFLSTEDAVLPGNLGLKDQVAALSWLRQNVAAFGGDPDSITLFGHSGGSASVALHVFSPLSAGLFSRAIAQSGPAVGSVTFTTGARERAFKLGALLGLQTNDSQQLVDFLRTAAVSDLVGIDDLITTDEEKLSYISLAFIPTLEPDLAGAFMSEAPQMLAREGRFNQVPFLTGTTSADGNILLPMLEDAEWLEVLNNNLSLVLAADLRDVSTTEERQDLASRIKNFYFGTGNNITNTPDGMLNASMMFTDIKFAEPTDSLLHLMAETATESLYYYEFVYRGPNTPSPQYPGVSHGGELICEFLIEDQTQDLDPDSEESVVRDRWVSMLSNFAKTGIPIQDTEGAEWRSFNNEDSYYLVVNVTDTLQQNKDEERMQFWRENMPL